MAQDVRWFDAVGDETAQPAEENRKLKRIAADLALDEDMLQDAVKRKP